MNKPIRALLLAITLPAMVLISSCRKDASLNTEPESVNQESSEARAKQKDILAWIDLHKQSYTQSQIKKLESVRNNLKFDELTVERRDNGDSLVIIPLKDQVKATLAINVNSRLSLLIVQDKNGKYKFSHIVAYNSADGSNVKKIKAGTIQNLINNKNISYDGEFQFHDIMGKLIFSQKYKDGKILSFSRIFTKDSTKSSQAIVRDCHDEYKGVWTYLSNGIMYYEEVFIGRYCHESEDGLPPSEQGVGDVPPSNPEPPSDLVFRNTTIRYESVGGLTNYDVSNPTTTELEYDIEGNIIPQVPAEKPVTKAFKVEVDINKSDGHIVNVYLTDIYASPSQSIYVNPTYGQITRSVDCSTSSKNFTITSNIIHCVWQGNLELSYVFVNGAPTQTRTQSINYTFDISNQ